MDEKVNRELFEVIQSSNINFLLGSGVSHPFLPILGNIENDLDKAKSLDERVVQYKKYFSNVMLPNKNIVDSITFSDSNYLTTKKSYTEFFRTLASLILRRKSTILSKQINMFTTNIDILMEIILEELQIEYNDGFSGRIAPTFSLANFKKSISQRSLHYDHVSEIPVFNIVKVHGSLTWKYDTSKENIVFSGKLDHFDKSLQSKSGVEFESEYKKILVVNPEEAKHLESVLNLYYSELLRMYSSELEKDNTTLFVLGFSMADRHIREITIRASKSNPTLRVFICCKASEVENFQKIQTVFLQ